MNIQIITAIASALALAAASYPTMETRNEIFYQAYKCNPVLLHAALLKAKEEVGGVDKLDICFKRPLDAGDDRFDESTSRSLKYATPFLAVLKGAEDEKKSMKEVMETYQMIVKHTNRRECGEDSFVHAALHMPKYGIELATELIKTGVTPLSVYEEPIMTTAYWFLGEDYDQDVKIVDLVSAVLAKPENVELLKSTGRNPMEKIAVYGNCSSSAFSIIKLLQNAGFPVDGAVIEKYIATTFNDARRAKDPYANARTRAATQHTLHIARALFRALQDPRMLVGAPGKLQSIDMLIADCGEYYDKHTSRIDKAACDPKLQRELQDLLDTVRREKRV